jgi:hypothetical protein
VSRESTQAKTMTYQTVFVIDQTTFPWWFATLGFVGAGLGVISWFFARAPRNRTIGVLMFCFGIVWSAVAFSISHGQWTEYQKHYAEKSFLVVEGKVENFVPMLPQGHSRETFSVNGVDFFYAQNSITPCFHHTKPHGGPVTGGLLVRVSYVDSCILKLEVLK